LRQDNAKGLTAIDLGLILECAAMLFNTAINPKSCLRSEARPVITKESDSGRQGGGVGEPAETFRDPHQIPFPD